MMATLSVVGVNCVNSKRIVQKAGEFLHALLSRARNPFLLDIMRRLAVLAGEQPTEEDEEGEQTAKERTTADKILTMMHRFSNLQVLRKDYN